MIVVTVLIGSDSQDASGLQPNLSLAVLPTQAAEDKDMSDKYIYKQLIDSHCFVCKLFVSQTKS